MFDAIVKHNKNIVFVMLDLFLLSGTSDCCFSVRFIAYLAVSLLAPHPQSTLILYLPHTVHHLLLLCGQYSIKPGVQSDLRCECDIPPAIFSGSLLILVLFTFSKKCLLKYTLI